MAFFPNIFPPKADKSSGGGQVSGLKNNPRNIRYMPVVVFIVLLDFGKKFLFMDRHCLVL
jgi:hypothetical protein